ncbi:MAG: hypothetical protein R6V04_08440 [bacterium]
MKKNTLLSIMNFVILLAMLVVNYLANALPINNQTTGKISDRFEVLFKPAGYAFSIWGLIYLGLLVFGIFQLLPKQNNSSVVKKIGLFFILSCFANIIWLFDWHYELYAFSVIVMLMLLFSLIKIYLNLEIGIAKVSLKEKWLVHQPFSLYLGWISVATIVNITVYLHWLNWDGFGLSPVFWFILFSIVGLALSFYFALARRDYLFNLVILWAYSAIAVHNANVSVVKTISRITSGLAVLPVIISISLLTISHQKKPDKKNSYN